LKKKKSSQHDEANGGIDDEGEGGERGSALDCDSTTRGRSAGGRPIKRADEWWRWR